jgi:hypothetical protein
MLGVRRLVASSVVRGSQKGESHGGVYLIDLMAREVVQTIDWNTVDIDWQGRGWDRGLRGIAIDGERVYMVSSDELFAYTADFRRVGSWRSPYLRHCHEICIHGRELFLASTGFDSILGFNLDAQSFDWAMHVQMRNYRFHFSRFDPLGEQGPLPLNKLHINNVYADQSGMYLSGLHTGGMLQFTGKRVLMSVELPPGTHNARPFRDGVLFNDTEAGTLRYSGRDDREDRIMMVPTYDADTLTFRDADTTGIARQGFARGLCVLSDSIVAGGSSPSTVTVYDLKANELLLSVNLTRDIRNAVHGLAVWPFD